VNSFLLSDRLQCLEGDRFARLGLKFYPCRLFYGLHRDEADVLPSHVDILPPHADTEKPRVEWRMPFATTLFAQAGVGPWGMKRPDVDETRGQVSPMAAHETISLRSICAPHCPRRKPVRHAKP